MKVKIVSTGIIADLDTSLLPGIEIEMLEGVFTGKIFDTGELRAIKAGDHDDCFGDALYILGHIGNGFLVTENNNPILIQ